MEESRYKYVLATPDVSVKDLVGYTLTPSKVAQKGIEMYINSILTLLVN